jgi:carbon monoxide dehydrogenase subunit G
MIAEHSLEIARTPAEVYAFLLDQDNWAALDPATKDITPRGAVYEGMTGTITRRVAGMRVRNGFLVTELEPEAKLSMRLTGAGYALTETTTLEATPDGTRVTTVDVLEPTSLGGRLFVAVSGPFIRRDLKARSERLRSLLGAAPATSR